jgi:ElaB/YqjD/DUF883 family membrane-anchored ribosome-binding protein
MEENKGTGTTESAAEEAAGRFAKAKEFVSDKYGAASEAVKDKYGAASEAVRNRYTAVRGKVEEIDFEEVTDKVREYVRSNPGKALLLSVGVGFAIGMLLRRGTDED